MGRTLALDRSIRYIHEPLNPAHPNRAFHYSAPYWYQYIPDNDGVVLMRDIQLAMHPRISLPNAASSLTLLLLNLHRKVRELNSGNPYLWFCSLTHCFFQHFYQELRGYRILIKDPLALFSAGWFYDKFGFRVICMIRHPLSFVGSLKKWGWTFPFDHLACQNMLLQKKLGPFSGEIKKFAHNGKDIIEQGCLLWNIMHYVIDDYRTKHPDWIFVRYEDLVVEPLSLYARIYTELGLKFSTTITRQINDFTNRPEKEGNHGPGFEPRNARMSLQAWKTRLTTSEVSKIEQLTGEIAKKFYG